eukprot:c17174_g1_i1 orf=84-566(+)
MARRLLQSILRHSVESFSRSASCSSPSPTVSHLGNPLSKHPWMLTTVQHYAKRRSKFAKDPYAWIKVGENEPCPSSQPNKGSVKNRNQKKRMAQRDAFIKEECQKRIAQCKAAKAKKLEAQKKRWKEGAARARAWKEKKLAEAKEAEAKEAEAQLSTAAA